MKSLAEVAFAATLVFSLAFLSGPLNAQDEKKPGKKPPPEKMEKGDAKKDKGPDEKKTDAKSDGDKAPEPTDEKQKKQFDKIKSDVEKKFRKSKKEQVFVYATSEKTMERVEPVEEATPPQQPPMGKGKMARPNGPPGAGVGGNARGTGVGGGGARGGGGLAGGSAHLEPSIKYAVYLTKDREEAIEKVYKFLVEFPPPLPGAKKKKAKGDEDPPAPERSLLSVQAFNATKEGEKQAEAAQEQLENKFRKETQAQEWKKQARKKQG